MTKILIRAPNSTMEVATDGLDSDLLTIISSYPSRSRLVGKSNHLRPTHPPTHVSKITQSKC